MKYSKRAGREVPVYRIVWGNSALQTFAISKELTEVHLLPTACTEYICACYRVK